MNARWIFSNLYVLPCVGKNFQFYGIHIPRKWIESMDFYSCPSSQLKLQVEFFEICFPHDEKGGEKYDLFIKIQSENIKMTVNNI